MLICQSSRLFSGTMEAGVLGRSYAVVCARVFVIWLSAGFGGSLFLLTNAENGGVLTPPYFNLAQGRRIEATATCGEGINAPELYCKLVGNAEQEDTFIIQGLTCDHCDPSRPDKSYPPEYAVDGLETRWQSPPLSRGMKYNEVNLTIDLGQEFHVAYVIVEMGNSPRPGVWVLERSADNGKTYQPWQYFADTLADCENFFGPESLFPITRDDSVICETQFSKIVPLEGGEIHVPLLLNRPSANDFFNSTVLQEWTRATNVRFRLLRTKTLLGHLMSVARQDPTVTRRYFYSIKDISIGGRCRCNGHADTCDITDPDDPYKLICRCQHNTCGHNCEFCCPGFVQKAWSQSKYKKPFVCEPCNCFGHSHLCVYNKTVDELHLSLDIHGDYDGGGVCMDCRDNTEGINCDNCKPGYFRPNGVNLNETNVCRPCECDFLYSTGNCAEGSGQCECKHEYKPPLCDDCSYGYYGYPNCKKCECNLGGTDGYYCETTNGTCPCKPNFTGKFCNQCADGYHNFPDCIPCDCNPLGSNSDICNVVTGQCSCISNFGGLRCDQCGDRYFDFPACRYCNCDIKGTEPSVCDKKTGRCECRKGYGGERCDQCVAGYYHYPDCQPCRCSEVGSVSPNCDITGKCPCLSNFGGRTCEQCSPGYYKYPECLACNCDSYGSIGVSCDNEGRCQCSSNFVGDRCDKCRPGLYNFPTCEECNCNPAGVLSTFGGCGSLPLGELCQCKPRVQGRVCDQCRPLYWNLQASNVDGCQDCDCHLAGVVGGIKDCDGKSGQCFCKPTVSSRRCDSCADGYYNLDDSNLFGCTECNCDIGGSANSICNKISGQCECQPRITGRTCNEPLQAHYFPTLHQYLYEAEQSLTPTNTPVRIGYDETQFPGYSWKGYAVFSIVQNEIIQEIEVQKPSLYRLIMRYVNSNNETINGTVKITPENINEVEQQFKASFKPTTHGKPAFVTVLGPLVMNPGKWWISIKIPKDLVLDYFVLLPAAFYEASMLANHVTAPCNTENQSLCRQYEYPMVNHFDHVRGDDGFIENGAGGKERFSNYFENQELIGNRRIPLLTSNQKKISFDLRASRSGPYVLIVNYVTEPDLRKTIELELDLNVVNNSMPEETSLSQNRVILRPCTYSIICRQVVVSGDSRVAIFQFEKDNVYRITFNSQENTDAAIESVTAIPYNVWSLGYVQPKPYCIKENGKCVPSIFLTPPESRKIEFEMDDNVVSISHPQYMHETKPRLVYLNSTEVSPIILGNVLHPGQYVIIVHYYQPEHPAFDLDVLITNGQLSNEAKLKVEHCPSIVGCRAVVKLPDGYDRFQLKDEFSMTLNNPNSEKTIWLDYALVMPAEQYSKDAIQVLPFDKTEMFITKCGNIHFYQDTSITGFCRDAVFILTTAYNNGALPCDCNFYGSLSFNCEQFGGQCQCKPNVIGRDCGTCKSGYYGFPECRPCRCPKSATCDPNTGECMCPKNVEGDLCDRCKPLTFGYELVNGCEPCNCNYYGVEGGNLQCNLFNGSCSCKPNVVGRTCDHCKNGHSGFPYCTPCDCDLRGTKEDICDQQTAECHCKNNVYGQACDLCKEGSYNLQQKNGDGCTKCFCFGKTTRCSSSSLYRTKMVGMDSWTLAIISRDKMVTVEPANVDIQKVVDGVGVGVLNLDGLRDDRIAYFVAPGRYLSNKLTSYGGNLTYSLLYTTENGDNPLNGADVILYGAGMYLFHSSTRHPKVNQLYYASIEIHESKFVSATDRDVPATREHLMQVLKDLEGLYIRAAFSENTATIRLTNVSLEYATTNYEYNAEIALSVEKCQCPPNYEGLSCESCADGFYRAQTGPFGGFCVPCQCNGHADTCDKVTGVCIGCKHSTVGEHCEMCDVGYHGDATIGTPYDCLICACPHPTASNNFAKGCDVSDDGERISCDCNEGYYGARCEFCAAGYFGKPNVTGEYCQPCQCSGNINPVEDGACDSLTGKCVRCLNNTFGESCQYCAPGFFGDAINMKDCQSCVCDKCGTESCDNHIGTCVCRDNVIGEKCDRCQDHHYGFNTCQGCRPCDCQIASESSQCEDSTGQCRCKPGVTGRNCDRCAPGYWNYTGDGCVSCGCNTEYSIGVSCNPKTGQCECLPGVIGEKCDHCPHRWVLVQASGCYDCDTCTHSLLDATDAMQNELAPYIEDFKTVAVAYFTTQRLTYIDDKVEQLSSNITSINRLQVDLSPIKDKIQQLEHDVRSLNRKSELAKESIDSLQDDEIQNRAIQVEKEISDVQKETTNIVDQVKNIVYNMKTSAGQTNDNALSVATHLLDELSQPMISGLDGLEHEAETGLIRSKDLLENTTVFVQPMNNMSEILNAVRDKIQNTETRLDDLIGHSNQARSKAFEAGQLNVKNRQSAERIKINKIKSLSDEAKQSFDETKTLANNASQHYKDAVTAYKDLNIERARLTTLKDQVEDSVTANEKIISEVQKEVEDARDYGERLDHQAKELYKLLLTSKTGSGDAVEAANSYTNIINATQEAMQAAADADNASNNASEIVEKLKDQPNLAYKDSSDLSLKAQNSLQTVQDDLQGELKNTKNYLEQVKLLHSKASTDFNNIKNELKNMENADVISDNPKSTSEKADTAENNAISILDDIQDIEVSLSKQMNDSHELYKNSEKARQSVQTATERLNDLAKILPNITAYKDALSQKSDKISDLSNTIKDKIKALKESVSVARDLVQRTDVGLELFSNSSMQLHYPDNLQDQSLVNNVSIYFRSEKPNGLVFYIGDAVEEDDDRQPQKRSIEDKYDFMALEIEDSYPNLKVSFGSSVHSITLNKSIANNRWYQAVISRAGKHADLTIKEDTSKAGIQSIGQYNQEEHFNTDNVIFDMNPARTKIFFGGRPINYRVPNIIKWSPFEGQVDTFQIGEKTIGLTNFVEATNIGDSSRKYYQRGTLLPPKPDYIRMNGESYIGVDGKNLLRSKNTNIICTFRTRSADGLLFLAFKDAKFFSVELHKGHVLMQYNLGDGVFQMESPLTYNDGNDHRIEATRNGKTARLRVDNESVKSGQSTGFEEEFEETDLIYFGGYPGGDHGLPDVTRVNFNGCLKHEVYFNTEFCNLFNYNSKSFKITPGCSDEIKSTLSLEYGARGYAHLSNVNSEESSLQLIFKFNTTNPNGIIAYAGDAMKFSLLALKNGALLFRSGKMEVESDPSKRLNDGKWHVVVATHANDSLELFIDDNESLSSSEKPHPIRFLNSNVYFGGVPSEESAELSIQPQFSGCLADVIFNGFLVDFTKYRVQSAITGKCVYNHQLKIPYVPPFDYNIDRGPPPPIKGEEDKGEDNEGDDDKDTGEDHSEEETEEESLPHPFQPEPTPAGLCKLPLNPAQDLEAYKTESGFRFGTKVDSRFEYKNLTQKFIKNKHEFSLEFKTVKSDGLIFYIADEKHKDFIALFLKDSFLRYRFNCGSGTATITSDKLVNDGEWHAVTFSRVATEGKLHIDHKLVGKGTSPGNTRTINVNNQPVYIGGFNTSIPEDKKNLLRQNLMGMNSSFEGCIRNVKKMEVSFGKPDKTVGVIPCSSKVETGVFFSADGGYIKAFEHFKVGVNFEMKMEIKPRDITGLLVVAYGKTFDYLILQMVDGEIIFSVDNGNGKISSSYRPPDKYYLCDGNWHTIQAVKAKTVVTLTVDSKTVPPGFGKGPHSSDTDSIYFGGHPNARNLKGVETDRPYVGCMKNVQLNHKSIEIGSQSTKGNITLSVCPTI